MPIIPGLMSYSYHLSFPEGKMTNERFIARADELNLKSTEWCHFPCHEPGKVAWEQVKLLDKIGRERGIENFISGFAPLLAQGSDRDYMLKMVQTQLEVSQFIGANRLRFHGMTEIELGIGVPAPLDICIDNLKRIVAAGEKAGIIIAIENHMDFRISDFRFFFNEIDSPYFKINLDTGNFLPLFENVVEFAEEFKNKIISCHFKGVRFIWKDYGAVLTSCQAKQSLVDLTAILKILVSCQHEIAVHIEVVTMKSTDEDLLVADHANFLHNFTLDTKNG
jgi:sugar phosphate isomerase/epimerase